MNRALTISPLRQAIGLADWLLLCFAAAGLGGLASVQAGTFYLDLARPGWAPPAWLFGPVWTVLYVLLGVGAWLIWREPGVAPEERRGAWVAFAIHALLNLAWTPIFFGLQLPGVAFFVICVLWVVLLWMTLRFGRIRPLAGYLQVPLVLWISFALVLNGTVWLINA